MELPRPQAMSFSEFVTEIEKGSMQIPQFQRDFIWTRKKSAKLIDSILRCYPIGTFILWNTRYRLCSVRSIGGQTFNDVREGDSRDFILDGQQRLTSLYACFKGLEIKRTNNRTDNFSEIYVNLLAEDDDPIVLTDISSLNSKYCIKVVDLYHNDLGKIFKKYKNISDEASIKLSDYSRKIASYQYSVIKLQDATVDVATDVFTRINVTGQTLTLFEIMVAKTYDEKKNFDLSEKWKALKKSLATISYDTINPATVLHTIALISGKDCKKRSILEIEKETFIENWQKTEDAIKYAAEYFRDTLYISASNLLPYDSLIVPFAYFFSHYNRKPNNIQQKYLTDFFWRVALTNRYSASVDTRLTEDKNYMDKFLKKNPAEYKTTIWGLDISPDFIKKNGYFKTTRAYIKAILCLYAYHQPKSFNSNSKVNIDNAWLNRSNSKNYHHFFPTAFLKQQGEIDDNINHILNITIVDEHLNREIGATSPSVYMKNFQKSNKDIHKTMETHLISDINDFGIFDDNYKIFLNKRADIVSKELSKRIIKNSMDGNQQNLPNEDDSD